MIRYFRNNVTFTGLFRILIAGCVVVYLSVLIDIPLIVEGLTYDLLFAVVLAQLMIFFSFFPLAFRIKHFSGGQRIPTLTAFKAINLSIAMNIVLPGRLSELVKPVFLNKNAELPLSQGLIAVFLERMSDLIIISGISFATIGAIYQEYNWKIFFLMLVFPIIFFLIIVRYGAKIEQAIASVSPSRIGLLAIKLLDKMGISIRRKGFLKGFFWGGVAWLLSISSFWFFLECSTAEPVDPLLVLELFIATTFAYALPALPGGFGTYEAAGIFVLTRNGFPHEQALLLTLSLHFCQLSVAVFVSLWVVLKDQIGVSDLTRQIVSFSKNQLGNIRK